jgi:predicted PurR-regulated permease PerM
MLGIDRRALRVAWTLFLFALTLLIVYKIGHALVILALALLFAYLLSPVVRFVERLFPPRVPPVASLLIVYLALLGVLAAATFPLVSRISQEAGALAARLPDVIQSDPLSHLPIPASLEQLRPAITSFVQDRLRSFGAAIGPMLAELGTRLIFGIGSLLGVILIPILSFFFLKDGTLIREAIIDSVALRRRELVANIISDIHLLLAQYIRALVLLSLATFAFYSIFLAVIGGPYPVLLGGVAAVLEFIPTVGPLIGAASIIIVAAATGFAHLWVVILFLAVYRIFQDYVLSPYLMSAGVELHPLMVLSGVLAGAELLGVPGMFFSVPVMAVLRLILIRLRRRHRAPRAVS